jgi:hypothetical protein
VSASSECAANNCERAKSTGPRVDVAAGLTDAVLVVPVPSDCDEAAADAWTTDDADQLVEVDVWLLDAGDDVDALNSAAVTPEAAAGGAATVAEVPVDDVPVDDVPVVMGAAIG